MKIRVDKESCIGCGVCVSVCDAVFELGDDGKSKLVAEYVEKDDDTESVGTVPDDIECVKDAVEQCPTGSITTE